jgi:hypothetical protein
MAELILISWFHYFTEPGLDEASVDLWRTSDHEAWGHKTIQDHRFARRPVGRLHHALAGKTGIRGGVIQFWISALLPGLTSRGAGSYAVTTGHPTAALHIVRNWSNALLYTRIEETLNQDGGLRFQSELPCIPQSRRTASFPQDFWLQIENLLTWCVEI